MEHITPEELGNLLPSRDFVSADLASLLASRSSKSGRWGEAHAWHTAAGLSEKLECAAATIRALQNEKRRLLDDCCVVGEASRVAEQERDAANARAAKAEQDRDRCVELNASYVRKIDELTARLEGDMTQREESLLKDMDILRAETADLREIERCIKSVWAADVKFATYTDGSFGLRSKYGGDFFATFSEWTVSRWQQAERAAWSHAAEPYRKRIEAAGNELTLRFREPHLAPVELSLWQSFRGEEYPGYPTIALLEKAAIYAETHPRSAQWAEAHPANHSEPPKSRCPLCGKPFND